MIAHWGDKVSIGKRYVRRYENGNKIWKAVPYKLNICIFLGIRTLSNGPIRYHYDGDTSYLPNEYFKAALISPSSNRNTIYAPLDSIWIPYNNQDSLK